MADEPGVTATNLREPAKLATDAVEARNPLSPICLPRFICRPLRGLGRVLGSVPRLGFAIAWGYYSLRLLRRLVE